MLRQMAWNTFKHTASGGYRQPHQELLRMEG